MNEAAPPASLVVLISGRGSNMRALIEAGRQPGAAFQVTHVIADNAGAGGLQIARALGVPAQVVAPPAGSKRDDRELANAVHACAPRLVALAGYMRILSADFVARFADRLLNIHPSLLPRHPGLHTHRRVIEGGEREHGATVHFVTAELDAGPRIIQARVGVQPGDTAEALAARVQTLEHRIYPLAAHWFCSGRLCLQAQQAWLDGQPLREPVQYGAEADLVAAPRSVASPPS